MRILVVEDQKEIADHLRISLEAECFAVDSADNGEKGLYLARINDYDVIILDNLLGQKSGMEVCSELRQSGKTVPIIILSVQSEINYKVALLNAGADDYLTKPFALEELFARIHALLRRPQPVQNFELEIADLKVDVRKHSVRREGREIYLTRKEFMLLEYLARNRGTVLSRAMIMEHVWDMNADPFSNTIESHILSLRRKIDTKGLVKLIHTVPGRGYKIDYQPVAVSKI
jgi:DNA-binding response OmpR family regulator